MTPTRRSLLKATSTTTILGLAGCAKGFREDEDVIVLDSLTMDRTSSEFSIEAVIQNPGVEERTIALRFGLYGKNDMQVSPWSETVEIAIQSGTRRLVTFTFEIGEDEGTERTEITERGAKHVTHPRLKFEMGINSIIATPEDTGKTISEASND